MKDKVKNIAERAVKTFCEVAVSMLTVGQAFTEVDWIHILSVSVTATIISVLVNVSASIKE